MKRHSIRSTAMRLLLAAIAALMLCLATAAPSHARFVTPDTWDPWLEGVDINRYAYGNNDPVNRSDPNGHQSEIYIGSHNRDYYDRLKSQLQMGTITLGGMTILYEAGQISLDDLQMHDKMMGSAMNSMSGPYWGAGSLNDWGNKGAHVPVPGLPGRPEVGISVGPDGNLIIQPAPGSGTKNGKPYTKAEEAVLQGLKDPKNLQRLLNNVNAVLDSKKGRGKTEELKRLKQYLESKLNEQKKNSKSENGKENKPKGKKN